MSNWLSPELSAALDKLSDAQVVSLTLYGEARSEPIEGIVAVASVIRNRVKADSWFGDGYRGVCLKPYQFSALNVIGGKGNFKQVLALAAQFAAKAPITEQKALKCIGVAECVIRELFDDETRSATHYHTQKLTPRPKWALGATMTALKGNHIFYKDVK